MQLFKHQRKTVDFAITHGGKYIDGSEMGTGKTLSTLKYIDETLLPGNPALKVLVIAPKSIILSGWVGDVHKFFPHIHIIPCIGTKKQKLDGFNSVGTIFVTNYESFHGKFNFDDAGFDLMVCDEAIKLKSPKAKWTKEITRLSRHIPRVILLSGLLTPNNLLEIYSPVNIIAPNLLGKSFWQFRSRFFTPNPFSYQQKEWVPKVGAEKAIMDIVRPYVIRHTKEECLDLPEQVETVREVEMTGKQKKYYNQMRKDAIVQLKDGTVPATTKATVLNKLLQISSGFVYDPDKDTHQFESSKLNELDDIINGELQNEKVLIFYTFRAEVEIFKAKYPGSSFITGGQKAEEQETAIKNFQSGDVRLAFASISAAKYGITLTSCSHAIYYSMSYSLDDMEQSKARIHRIGQTRTTSYIYLLSKGTVDMRVYRAIQKKQGLNEIVNGLLEEG